MAEQTHQSSANRAELIRRQQVLAEFREFVLDHDDIDEVLTEACRLIARALDAHLAKVIEIDRDKNEGFVRAGVGWKPGVVGSVRLDLDERSSETFAIAIGEPVITNDISRETRFRFPQFLKDHGVVALINVPIFLPGRIPYGILQVDTRETREFDQDDIDYLKTYAMTLGPVIDRLNSKSAEKETDQKLSAAFDVLPVGIGIMDMNGDLYRSNPEIKRFLPSGKIPSRDESRTVRWEVSDAEGKPIGPDNWPSARALRGDPVFPGLEMLYHQDDGKDVWAKVAAAPITDANGAVAGAVVVIHDVTGFKEADAALRESERHAQVLLAELQHRVRNTLAVVRSIARRTAQNSKSVDDLLSHFEGRLAAFSRVQAALTRRPDAKVDLLSLVEDEFLAHATREGEQVRIEGEPIALEPRLAERLSLAIHELTTNAVKHGALMNGSGRIGVKWKLSRNRGGRQFHLEWKESGLTFGRRELKREGFGLGLLRRSLPYDLQGETTVELEPDGLRFKLKMPMPDSPEPASNPDRR